MCQTATQQEIDEAPITALQVIENLEYNWPRGTTREPWPTDQPDEDIELGGHHTYPRPVLIPRVPIHFVD